MGIDINFDTTRTAAPFHADQVSQSANADDYLARPERTVKDWYTRRMSLLWCVINVVGASGCVVVGWSHVPHAILVAWLLFTSLNAALYVAISHELSHWLQREDNDSGASQIGMAFVFGISWGAFFLLVGPFVPEHELYVLIGLGLLVSTFALPVFCLHRAAYLLFAVPIATFFVIAAGGRPNFEFVGIFTALALVTLLLIAAGLAGLVRTAVNALSDMITITDPDGKLESGDLKMLFARRTKTLKRLIREQRRATATLDAIGEAIVTTNEAGLIDFMNPVAEVLTGVQFAEASGRNIEGVVDVRTEGSANSIAALLATCRAAGRVQSSGEHVILKRCDGIEYEIEYQFSAIRNSRGEVAGTSCLLRDVTTKHNLMKTVAWRATHDPLTNLINRTEFEARIKNLLASKSDNDKQRHALCFIDFDEFKFINETHGMEAGDHVLKSIAVELKQKIRGADTLARIGDDKFGVLLYSCPIDKAKLIAEGLRRLVENFQTDWKTIDVSVSVSVGVIEIDPLADDLTDILSGAEAACECAKKDSGNRVHVFHTGEQSQQHRGDSIKRLREIQSAIRSNRLELYFQHIHAIKGECHQPRTCNLLLRMRDAAGETLSPREFLVTAERYQLMPEIDRWVAKAAVDALRVKHPSLRDMDMVCINISGQSINDDRFLEFIVELLDDDDVDGSRICFDISEASLISSIERGRFFIATLKQLGCRVALDDFGIGMSSFELLKRLQVDYLKISADFIRNMAYNSVDYEIVLALSRIAKSLRVQTIAEGVTTLATKDSLMGMGVDYVQGLLIDQPRALSIDGTTVH